MIVYDEQTQTLTVEDERTSEILMFGMPSFDEIEIEDREPNFDGLIFCRNQAD